MREITAQLNYIERHNAELIQQAYSMSGEHEYEERLRHIDTQYDRFVLHGSDEKDHEEGKMQDHVDSNVLELKQKKSEDETSQVKQENEQPLEEHNHMQDSAPTLQTNEEKRIDISPSELPLAFKSKDGIPSVLFKLVLTIANRTTSFVIIFHKQSRF